MRHTEKKATWSIEIKHTMNGWMIVGGGGDAVVVILDNEIFRSKKHTLLVKRWSHKTRTSFQYTE